MTFDQAAYDRQHAAEHAAHEARTTAEATLDDLAGVPPAVIAKVARRILAVLSEHDALNAGADDFEDGLRAAGEVLNVPYIELIIAAHTNISNPEIVRDDLGEWVAWCQQHAPERLAAPKGGA